MNVVSEYYRYTPLEHTITNILWAVFACTAIALICVLISKAKRVKKLEDEIRRLQDQLMEKSSKLAAFKVLHEHGMDDLIDPCIDGNTDTSIQTELVEPHIETYKVQSVESSNKRYLAVGLATALTLIGLGFLISWIFPKEQTEQEAVIDYRQMTPAPIYTATPKPASTPRPTPTPKPLREVSFPPYNTATGSNGFGDCGTLTINSSSTYKYTFLSIVPVGLSTPSIRVYMHGGDTYDVEVPYGTYRIYCAEGDKYYGIDALFGSYGVYSELEGTFEFYEDDEYIYGHTLTLYSVYDGNLDSDSISLYEFPH